MNNNGDEMNKEMEEISRDWDYDSLTNVCERENPKYPENLID